MKKQFLLIAVFLTLFSSINAQKKEKNLLLGTWESNGITINEVIYSETDGTTWLSFYPKNVFQETLLACRTNPTEIKCDTVSIRTGKWNLTKKKQLIFSDYHLTPNGGIYVGGWDTMMVVTVTDTSLTLSSTETKPEYYLHFKKIPAQPIIPDNFPTVFFPVVAPNDSTKRFDIYLVNSTDSSRKIKIESNTNDLEINLTETKTDTSILTRTWYSGSIKALTDSSIFITYQQKNVHMYDDGKYPVSEIIMTWSGIQVPYGELSLKSISSVRYSTPVRSTWFGIGGGLTFFASLTTLVVAPLVSIDYRNGGFNSTRYLKWAVAGLCGLGISIPLMLITKPRTYLIASRNTLPVKDHWYFDKQPVN
ncbi:MAG: hypothetical protein M3R17_17790 [Bacteroidota bacterium]|nr:hypothetical protein [Bacteroidota bacterium]